MSINSYRNKNALFIGNGVNLLDPEQSFSWGRLLDELQQEFGTKVDLDNDFKPFPLAFEEMLHKMPTTESFERNIRALKQNIRGSIDAQLYKKNGFNSYHEKITTLPYSDILTTNYDYSLEKSMAQDFEDWKDKKAMYKREQKFSLRRGYSVQDKVFWHIHGELVDSRSYSETSKNYAEESIMIGYEHYAAYLDKIQENISGKRNAQKIEDYSLLTRLRKTEEESPYWVDKFFTHNIDIIGQGFDFSEIHLWWLINYRANEMQKRRKDIYINNRIRFFYPVTKDENDTPKSDSEDLKKYIKKINGLNKAKAIAEVLVAHKVQPMPIEIDATVDKASLYKVFYDRFIALIQKEQQPL